MTHVIVTGGSSGIGLDVAGLYLLRGHSVTLIARRSDLLEIACHALSVAIPGSHDRIHIASADVADEAGLKDAICSGEKRFGPCDILVACAGRVDPAFFDALPSDLFEEQVRVNLFGVANAVRAVYSGMRKREAGRIMLVSSGAAQIGIPAYTAYCASKSALKGFGEALRAEARPFGVTVSVCYPPDTHTPQYEREMLLRPAAAEAIMGTLKPWKAGTVALHIMKGLDRGRGEVHFGFALTMLALFGAFIKPVIYWRAAHDKRR